MYEHSRPSYEPRHWGSSTGDLPGGAGATADSQVPHQTGAAAAGQWLNPVSTATQQWMAENDPKMGPVLETGSFLLSWARLRWERQPTALHSTIVPSADNLPADP